MLRLDEAAAVEAASQESCTAFPVAVAGVVPFRRISEPLGNDDGAERDLEVGDDIKLKAIMGWRQRHLFSSLEVVTYEKFIARKGKSVAIHFSYELATKIFRH
nr:hypothetical protein Iba_scaffold6462CG0470 [Ipomoea batatas]